MGRSTGRKTKDIVLAVLVVLVLGLVLNRAGVVSFAVGGGDTATASTQNGTQIAKLITGIGVTDNGLEYKTTTSGTSTLSVSLQNMQLAAGSTLEYEPTNVFTLDRSGTVLLAPSGGAKATGSPIVGSTTLTGGTTQVYTTITVPNGAQGIVFPVVTGTTSEVTTVGTPQAFFAKEPSNNVVNLAGQNVSTLKMWVYDIGYRNITVFNASIGNQMCTNAGCLTANVTASGTAAQIGLAKNGVFSGNIVMRLNATGSTHGLGTMAIFNSTNAYGPNDFRLGGIFSPSPCTTNALYSIQGVKACFVASKVITISDQLTTPFTLNPTIAAPTAGSTGDTVIFADLEAFRDVTGSFTFDYFNGAGADVGVPNSQILFTE